MQQCKIISKFWLNRREKWITAVNDSWSDFLRRKFSQEMWSKLSV